MTTALWAGAQPGEALIQVVEATLRVATRSNAGVCTEVLPAWLVVADREENFGLRQGGDGGERRREDDYDEEPRARKDRGLTVHV